MPLTSQFRDKLDHRIFHKVGWHHSNSVETFLHFNVWEHGRQRILLFWQWMEFFPSRDFLNGNMGKKIHMVMISKWVKFQFWVKWPFKKHSMQHSFTSSKKVLGAAFFNFFFFLRSSRELFFANFNLYDLPLVGILFRPNPFKAWNVLRMLATNFPLPSSTLSLNHLWKGFFFFCSGLLYSTVVLHGDYSASHADEKWAQSSFIKSEWFLIFIGHNLTIKIYSLIFRFVYCVRADLIILAAPLSN